jgi:hypothetical protein
MNISLFFNVFLGGTVLVGFFVRYLRVLTHKVPAHDGRLGLAVILAAILYGGIILASIDKLQYVNVLKSFIILGLVCLALDTALGKLAKNLSDKTHV